MINYLETNLHIVKILKLPGQCSSYYALNTTKSIILLKARKNFYTNKAHTKSLGKGSLLDKDAYKLWMV